MMKRILYLDCFSGISGDMTVGALCDLGVPPSTFEWELAKLELGDFHTHWERAARQSIHGVHFSIHAGATHRQEAVEHEGPEHGHSHEHEHGHEGHDGHEHDEHDEAHGRSYAAIRELLSASALSPFVKEHALGIFQRIAVAEGKIHGVPAAEVHFHEVGALDSIADIVCACVGIEALKVDAVEVSALAEGRGWIECAHGRFPIPAPATLEILAGIPLGEIDEPFEFITPTGAAIVAEFGRGFAVRPRMTAEKIGYGIGTRASANRPNVLRAVLGSIDDEEAGGAASDVITCLETNLDDLPPEMIGAVFDRAFAAGALDVFCTPVQMKKNRLATQLTVLCTPETADAMIELLFAHTTTFGVRRCAMERVKLERRLVKVRTPFGEVTVKVGSRHGLVVRVSPEYDSCRAVSEATGASLLDIYRAAQEAFGA